MARRRLLERTLLGTTAAVLIGGNVIPGHVVDGRLATVAATGSLGRAANVITAPVARAVEGNSRVAAGGGIAARTQSAVEALSGSVAQLSHPRALEDAFRSYFAYKAAHPETVKKPLLYFVDYGLPSTTPRGYVFDMESLTIVDGPFTVAHGRGSAGPGEVRPTRFSNASGSAATSLGLYVAQELYNFSGHAMGGLYNSVGLRLQGVSQGWNDNARARGVVAHGAPYVTANRAGRSEGCPAMESARAHRLLPKLANGGMVFLFAPDANWMSHDPWVSAATAG